MRTVSFEETHPGRLCPKSQLETSRFLNRSNTLQTSGKQHSVESECGHLCDTTAATATSTKKPSEF